MNKCERLNSNKQNNVPAWKYASVGEATSEDESHKHYTSQTPSFSIHKERVCLDEKTSVFVLGLLICELFGGQRNGTFVLARTMLDNQKPFLEKAFADTDEIPYYTEQPNAMTRFMVEWEKPLYDISSLENMSQGSIASGKLLTPHEFYKLICYPQVGLFGKEEQLKSEIFSLLDSCLQQSPSKRPKFQELLVMLEHLKHIVATSAP